MCAGKTRLHGNFDLYLFNSSTVLNVNQQVGANAGRMVAMKNVTWKPRALGIFGLVVFTILGLAILGAQRGGGGRGAGGAAQGQASTANPDDWRIDPTRGPVDLGLTDPSLVGAIDVHQHSDPDAPGAGGQIRALDGFEAAIIAKQRGMRGIVNARSRRDATRARPHVQSESRKIAGPAPARRDRSHTARTSESAVIVGVR